MYKKSIVVISTVLIVMLIAGCSTQKVAEKEMSQTMNETQDVLNESEKQINQTGEEAQNLLNESTGAVHEAKEQEKEIIENPEIVNVTVKPSSKSVTITWKTTKSAASSINLLGREAGEVLKSKEMIPSRFFDTKFRVLEPDTQYDFTITVMQGGNRSDTYQGSFRTEKVLKRDGSGLR